MTVTILLLTGISTNTAEADLAVGPLCRTALAPRLCAIHVNVHRTNHLRSRMGQGRIVYGYFAERHPALRDRALLYWRAVRAKTLARLKVWLASPWLHGSWYEAAMCVHSKEGAWNNPDTSGAGYYGGMQFDITTWLGNGGGTYASRPDYAAPAEQLRVAYRTWQSRGWSPWPNTARECGLL